MDITRASISCILLETAFWDMCADYNESILKPQREKKPQKKPCVNMSECVSNSHTERRQSVGVMMLMSNWKRQMVLSILYSTNL